MFRITLMRGCAATALCYAALTNAFAQEALPTIEVGARQSPSASQGRGLTDAGPLRVSSPSGPVEAHPIPEDNQTYRPENATTALKTNTPIMETPASVQVIPRAVLEDQQVTSISQAVNNVSGVIALDQAEAGDPSYLIRGFITNNYYLDGLRVNTFETGTRQNFANVDRVELLKGPASILYGRADPGGIVNVITRRPLETPSYSVEQQFGSWASYRTTLDATGPLNADKSLLYRLDVAYENENQFWHFSNSHVAFVAPKLNWRPDEHTDVNLFLQYQSQASPNYSNFPAFANLGPNSQDPIYTALYGARPISFLPRNESINQPWARGGGQDLIVGFNWSRDLNENWNFKNRFMVQKVDQYNVNLGYVGWTGGEPYQLDQIAYILPAFNQQVYSTNADLTGKFKTFGVGHTLLVGSDFQHFHSRGYNLTNFMAPPTNLLAPFYYPYSPLPFLDTSLNSPAVFAFHENWWGAYLQDQMTLPYNLFLLAGARYDHAINYSDDNNLYDSFNGFTINPPQVTSNAKRVTPRFGLLWRPLPEFSVYGSYLTNFGPHTSNFRRPLPPETAQQWEVGVKAELFDKRVTATIAYYDLIKQHVAVADPDPALAAQGYQVALGEVRHRGPELDISGEILPGWKVIGGYSYISSIVSKDGFCSDPINNPNSSCVFDAYNTSVLSNPILLSVTGNQGKRLAGVPRHSGSFFTTYEFQDGDFKGLKVGGGMQGRSLAQGDSFNTYQVPGYAIFNLMAAYETKIYDRKTTLQLNVNNLLDTRYYAQGFPGSNALVGTPRSFRGSLKVEF